LLHNAEFGAVAYMNKGMKHARREAAKHLWVFLPLLEILLVMGQFWIDIVRRQKKKLVEDLGD
jgi:hypothetical protein